MALVVSYRVWLVGIVLLGTYFFFLVVHPFHVFVHLRSISFPSFRPFERRTCACLPVHRWRLWWLAIHGGTCRGVRLSSSTSEWPSIPLESFFSPWSERRIQWKKKQAKTTRPIDSSQVSETIQPTSVGIRIPRHQTCRRNRRQRTCPRPCRREWEGRERRRFPIEAVRNTNHTNEETSKSTSAS